MKRLLKKEMKTVGTNVLNMRYCRILECGETMDAKDIPVADAREILWIEEELRSRVIKGVGHDFYPPDRIEEETISSIKSPLPPLGLKIPFKVSVFSSLGTKAGNFIVNADSKIEADLLARKQIRSLGLRRATYKIS